ncbi:unnamed protein product [Diabrotica balteata]|uniref:PSMD12/CSN4-like N-terminal domain-containing protein n=1 Tax=Diabrotica balteata TaxID=107213 RepID=A0A9N9SNC2_DIABA|nr:unnamed protein product [Diabrotica balteata]
MEESFEKEEEEDSGNEVDLLKTHIESKEIRSVASQTMETDERKEGKKRRRRNRKNKSVTPLQVDSNIEQEEKEEVLEILEGYPSIAPVQSIWHSDDERRKKLAFLFSKQLISNQHVAPPYGQRCGWVLKSVTDFGDRGAFLEIHAKNWAAVNEQIVLLSKRRSQLKQAVAKMVQECCTYVNKTSDKETKVTLIGTLRKVTECKIYVGVERVRLTHKLAKIYEDADDIQQTADII